MTSKSNRSSPIDLSLLLQNSPIFVFDSSKHTLSEHISQSVAQKHKIAVKKDKLKCGFQKFLKALEKHFGFKHEVRLLRFQQSDPLWVEISRKPCDLNFDFGGPQKSCRVLISEVGQFKVEVLGRTFTERQINSFENEQEVLRDICDVLDDSRTFCGGYLQNSFPELVKSVSQRPCGLKLDCCPYPALRASNCKMWITKVEKI